MDTFGPVLEALKELGYGYLRKQDSVLPIIRDPAERDILKKAKGSIYCLQLINLHAERKRPNLSLRTGNLSIDFFGGESSNIRDLPFGFGGVVITPYHNVLDFIEIQKTNPVLYRQMELINDRAFENNKITVEVSYGHGGLVPEKGRIFAQLQDGEVDKIHLTRAMKAVIAAQTNFDSLIDFLAVRDLKAAGIIKKD